MEIFFKPSFFTFFLLFITTNGTMQNNLDIYINNGIYNFVRIYEMEHERECRENAETNHILPTEKRWHP